MKENEIQTQNEKRGRERDRERERERGPPFFVSSEFMGIETGAITERKLIRYGKVGRKASRLDK